MLLHYLFYIFFYFYLLSCTVCNHYYPMHHFPTQGRASMTFTTPTSNGFTTAYPGGLLRCDPPSPASVQPVLPVEDKRGRSNHPHRAPPTSSQPFCPYPIAITPQQYEVYTLQMAKRVTMRVHSPRFPKFGSWETPRPELANST